MFLRLLAAFILIPLIELFLLLKLAAATSVWTTFLLVIITGIIGSLLAKREGVMAWRKFHQALAEGRMPGQEIQDGLMIVFAAALLLTPGLLTDAVGFFLLVPPGRALVRKFVLRRYLKGAQWKFTSTQTESTFQTGFAADPERSRRRRGQQVTIDATAVHHKEPS